MTYEEVVEDLVKLIEAIGIGIMVIGGAAALIRYVPEVFRTEQRSGAYERLRRGLGRVILVGLEVLIVADIVRTIVVEPTLESVAVLGVIVLIRIVLSFSLEVEIDGRWPWQGSRGRSGDDPGASST